MPFIKFHVVFPQEMTILVLEALLAMMLLLVIYVVCQILQLAPAYREIAVTSLPEKLRVSFALALNPGGRGFLDLFQQLCLGDDACQARGDMDVIGGASNTVGFATAIAAYRGQISVHARPDRLIKPGAAVLGAEDNVEDDLAEGLRHR